MISRHVVRRYEEQEAWRILEAAAIARAASDPGQLLGLTGAVMSREAIYALECIESDPYLASVDLCALVVLALNVDSATGRVSSKFADNVLRLCELATSPRSVASAA